MPGFDGTGPSGLGPMTGRGLGFCHPRAPQPYGYGRGFGFDTAAVSAVVSGAGLDGVLDADSVIGSNVLLHGTTLMQSLIRLFMKCLIQLQLKLKKNGCWKKRQCWRRNCRRSMICWISWKTKTKIR